MNYIIMCKYKYTLSQSLYVVRFLFICELYWCCQDVLKLVSQYKFIAHIVGGYQNEQPLADKFLESGKHSYTEYE